jgi:hypothetical protein
MLCPNDLLHKEHLLAPANVLCNISWILCLNDIAHKEPFISGQQMYVRSISWMLCPNDLVVKEYLLSASMCAHVA